MGGALSFRINTGPAVRIVRTPVLVRSIGTAIGVRLGQRAVLIARTGSQLNPVGKVEPVAASAAPVAPIELLEDDQAGNTQNRYGAGRGVFGDSDTGGDVSNAEGGGPPIMVWERSEGEVLQGGPRQRAQLAPPVPAVGADDQRGLRGCHSVVPLNVDITK